MRRHPRLHCILGTLAFATVVAGCMSDPAAKGSAYGHAQRSESNAWLVELADGFEAGREIVVTNGPGDAIFTDVQLTTTNGAIDVIACDCDAYQLVAQVAARGSSEEQARQRLDALSFNATDLDSGQLLAIHAEATSRDWDNSSVNLRLMLPGELIAADGRLSTRQGNIAAINIRTESLQAITEQGDVQVTVRPAGEGTIRLASTQGNVALHIQRGEEPLGIDARATLTSGLIDLAFHDTDALGEQSATYRRVQSPDYDDLGLKLDARLSTVHGTIRGTG